MPKRFQLFMLLLTAWAICAPDGAAAQDVTGNPEQGSWLFRGLCGGCHVADPRDPRQRIGPSLQGVIGRTAGTVKDYPYSPAMVRAGQAGLIWTPNAILTYLADPQAMVPGNKMALRRVVGDQKRADIVAYLKSVSK